MGAFKYLVSPTLAFPDYPASPGTSELTPFRPSSLPDRPSSTSASSRTSSASSSASAAGSTASSRSSTARRAPRARTRPAASVTRSVQSLPWLQKLAARRVGVWWVLRGRRTVQEKQEAAGPSRAACAGSVRQRRPRAATTHPHLTSARPDLASPAPRSFDRAAAFEAYDHPPHNPRRLPPRSARARRVPHPLPLAGRSHCPPTCRPPRRCPPRTRALRMRRGGVDTRKGARSERGRMRLADDEQRARVRPRDRPD